MIWPRRTARTSWFQFPPLGLSTHSPCVIRSAPRRNETGRVAPVPPIGPLVSLASGLRLPPETPNGWQGAALVLRKRSPRKSGPTPPRHRIIARLYNVGVGGILAQHLAKCCPCRSLQARLTALCEPCGTPPVALAGCGLHRRPARCTSHGPRLDRRAAPHRDRHSPFAPLRSGGPQAATPATPRLLRVSRRPLFRARCASGQPSPVPRSRLRQAPPSPRCPSWPALSRNPGHPPLRARFPRRLAFHFSPDGAGPPPAIWQFNPARK